VKKGGPSALAAAPLGDQIHGLMSAVRKNAFVRELLERADEEGLPDWYLGAGCVAQTVWNLQHSYDATASIKDYDLVYFDKREDAPTQRQREDWAETLSGRLGIILDVHNEATVHRWYPTKFGVRIPPYRSTGHAISTWPTTASSVGLRISGVSVEVCAPFGLHDLLAGIVRPNKVIVPRAVYEEKAQRWLAAWPHLKVMPWDS
jgi:uncharacterized protein